MTVLRISGKLSFKSCEPKSEAKPSPILLLLLYCNCYCNCYCHCYCLFAFPSWDAGGCAYPLPSPPLTPQSASPFLGPPPGRQAILWS